MIKTIIPWKYNNELFVLSDDQINEFVAFVYLIVDKKRERRYIGKKYLWVKVSRPPLKGKTRKRISWKQSDWQTYTSSCIELSNNIEADGCENFEFEILHLCSTKGNASYLEAKEQFLRNVLTDTSYYNNIIQCRIHSKHVKM